MLSYLLSFVMISAMATEVDENLNDIAYSLFQHFHIKSCVVVEEFYLKKETLMSDVKEFSRWNMVTGLWTYGMLFMVMTTPELAPQQRTTVLFKIFDELGLIRIIWMFSQIQTNKFMFMVFLAPHLTLHSSDIKIRYDCEFLVIKMVNGSEYHITELYYILGKSKEIFFGNWDKDNGLAVRDESFYRARWNFEDATPILGDKPCRARCTARELWSCLEVMFNFSSQEMDYDSELIELISKQPHTYNYLLGYTVNVGFHSTLGSAMSSMIGPIRKYNYYLFIRRPRESSSFWRSYIKPFSDALWLIILLWTVLFAVSILSLRFVAEWTGLKSQRGKFDKIGYGLLTVDSLCNQRGKDVSKSSTSFCVAYFMTQVVGIFLYYSYSAMLTSFLAIHKLDMPFHGFDGFMQDINYNLTGAPHGFSEIIILKNDLPKVKEMVKHRYSKFNGITMEFVSELCNKKIAFLESDEVVCNLPFPCQMIRVPQVVATFGGGIQLTPNSNFSALFHSALTIIRSVGIVQKLQAEADRATCNAIHWDKAIEVDLKRALPLLMLLGLGVVLSVVIAIIEATLYLIHRLLINRPFDEWRHNRMHLIHVSERISSPSYILFKHVAPKR